MRGLLLSYHVFIVVDIIIQNIYKCVSVSFSGIIHIPVTSVRGVCDPWWTGVLSRPCRWFCSCPALLELRCETYFSCCVDNLLTSVLRTLHSSIRQPDLLKRSRPSSSALFHSHEVVILGRAVSIPSSFVCICFIFWKKPYFVSMPAWHRVFQVAQETSQDGRKSESELWGFTVLKNSPSGKIVIKQCLKRTFLSHFFPFFKPRTWKSPRIGHIVHKYHIFLVWLWFFSSDSQAHFFPLFSIKNIEAASSKKDLSIGFNQPALPRHSRIEGWENVTQMFPFNSAVVHQRMSTSVSLKHE